MNSNDPQIEALAGQPGLPTFPTWPPPSGGAPVTAWEMGPITNPFPYGSAQGPNISTAPPSLTHPYPSTFYPKKMPTGASGQNQNQKLPALVAPWEVGPIKAPPSLSQIQPPPIMGPGSGVPHLLASQIGRSGPAQKTFPAGSYIDGLGTVVTPTRVIGGLGN
jgi:hypothetical protein